MDAKVQQNLTEIKSLNIIDSLIENTAINDSEDITADYKEFGFYIFEGRYHTIEKTNRGIEISIELSNFTMKSMFHLLNGSNNTIRIIFIQRQTGQKHFVEVYSSEMKNESFETILKSKRCTFFGNAYQLKRVFARMMDEETEAVTLDYLGWNYEHQIYVLADSIFNAKNELLTIDQLGIIATEKENYYLPSFGFTNVNNENFKTDRLYKFEPGITNFKTWSLLFYQAFGSNAVIGMLYTILALYRDVIFAQVGFFPFLFLFGDFGTGKTSYTEKLLSLFGRDTIGTPLNNATIVALSRLVSSRCNSLFYFKEYTNETDNNAEDFILTAYDGAGRTTGIKTNDNKTKSFPVRSALIFDGNHLPSQKSAILSRMILLNFENSTFTAEQTTAFKKLKDFTDKGLGNVLLELLKLRPIFEEKFTGKYREVSRKIKDSGINLPERSINHTALLYSVFEMLEKEISFPFSMEIANKVIVENAENLNNLLTESSVISVFWQSFSFNLKKGQISKYDELGIGNRNIAHFNLKYDPDLIIQLKIPSFYPFYVKYCKENNIRFLDSNSIRMILTSKSNTSFIHSHQKGRNQSYTDKKFGSCYQFRADKTDAGIEINGVEINI
jgi:hypothetical protein